MPLPSPLHVRTSALCDSLRWKEWAGYHAVCSYDTHHDAEYQALRQAAGLLDVSPLFKVDVTGPDAGALLSYMLVRDVEQLALERVTYTCWCTEAGQVLDDGTVTRLADEHYRLTSAEPVLWWLERLAPGYDVNIRDRTADLATLALQGPGSRAVLRQLAPDLADSLRWFRAGHASFGGTDLLVTRTGYTGDLGYELWIDAARAPELWDAVMQAGAPHRLLPVGLDALDVARIEAGFLLGGVDYVHAADAEIPAQRSSPYALDLGWMVQLERGPFVGREALLREREAGSPELLVGLELEWDSYAALFAEHDLAPAPPSGAWRCSVPLYAAEPGGRQVGYATSGAWSPLLKRNLALATVEAGHAALGTQLELEVTVRHTRRRARATVVPRPFFDPERKRSTPA